ncbi:MAG: DUF642 domain-containing protein, partial [Planctomycetes bacterium]|nr:DUF642 domain-containing protein [Planctomycetota bacterium]
TLNDPNSSLEITGDLDLASNITINNPGNGKLSIGGDLTYTHTVETLFDFGNSFVTFSGPGVQSVEVGGLDVGDQTQFLTNGNFGYGQMILGVCNTATTVVQLVDQVDNGNTGGGNPEVLYLFGKDGQDGLRILNSSTLVIGDPNVYAMLGGVMTNLHDLFLPGQTLIDFDEGYILRRAALPGHPANLITGGGFETGVTPPLAGDLFVSLPFGSTDVDDWTVTRDTVDWTHEAFFTDPGDGERVMDLGGTPAAAGGVKQSFTTVPGHRYLVYFDLGANPYGNLTGDPNDTGLRHLGVRATDDFSAASTAEFVFDATEGVGVGPAPEPNDPWPVHWRKESWSFTATCATTTLEFFSMDDNPPSQYGVAIDNVVVLASGSVPLNIPADFNGDNIVNYLDFTLLMENYLRTDCSDTPTNCNCDGTDTNGDGRVDEDDLDLLIEHWLEQPHFCEFVIPFGPMIFSGMDPEEHLVPGDDMIRDILEFVVSNSTLHPAPQNIAMLGGSTAVHADAAAIVSELGYTVTRLTGAAITNADFNPLTTVYDAIYMPTSIVDWVGGLSAADMVLINARGPDIVGFVNDGGGLAAFSQNVVGGYGWMPLGGLQVVDLSPQGLTGITVTPEGNAILSPSATAVEPYHQAFLGPEGFFGLDVLATESSGQLRTIIIGGLGTLP